MSDPDDGRTCAREDTVLSAWLRNRWRCARRPLHDFGITGPILRMSFRWTSDWFCHAYVLDDDRSHVFVQRRWAQECLDDGDNEQVQQILRHEWLHLLLVRRPDIRRRFRVPPVDTWRATLRQAYWLLGLIDYRQVSKEEALAERVGELNPRTLRAIADML